MAPAATGTTSAPPTPAGGQGAVDPQDIAEAVLLGLRVSPNCVPEEIVLKAAAPA